MNYCNTLEQFWQDHLAPKSPSAPTVISTFAGCGSSSLGYAMAGFRELLAVEWDEHAAATFKANFPEGPLYQGDIAKLSVECTCSHDTQNGKCVRHLRCGLGDAG
ncbi:DNA cytosine methyltransferase [bacterium]|nr:DNA cytosine methyltransferase [bacterium]